MKKVFVSVCLYGKREYVDAFMIWYQQFIEITSMDKRFTYVLLLAVSDEILAEFPILEELQLSFFVFKEVTAAHHSINMLQRYDISKFNVSFSDDDIVAFRDVDCTFTSRELLALNLFVDSGRAFQTIQDHPAHNLPILGGLLAGRISHVRDLFPSSSIEKYRARVLRWRLVSFWGFDQHFLNAKLFGVKNIFRLSIFDINSAEAVSFFKNSSFLGNKLLLGCDDFWIPSFKISNRQKLKTLLINFLFLFVIL